MGSWQDSSLRPVQPSGSSQGSPPSTSPSGLLPDARSQTSCLARPPARSVNKDPVVLFTEGSSKTWAWAGGKGGTGVGRSNSRGGRGPALLAFHLSLATPAQLHPGNRVGGARGLRHRAAAPPSPPAVSPRRSPPGHYLPPGLGYQGPAKAGLGETENCLGLCRWREDDMAWWFKDGDGALGNLGECVAIYSGLSYLREWKWRSLKWSFGLSKGGR